MKAVVIDVAIATSCFSQEAQEIPNAESGSRENVECEDSSDNRSTR